MGNYLKIVFYTAILVLVTGVGWSDELSPMPVPKWIESSTIGTFVPPTDEEGWKEAAESGLEITFNSGGLTGFPWMDGDRFYYLDPKTPYEKAVDIDFTNARAKVELAHKYGIKVIGSMMNMWELKVLADHPDWQRVDIPKKATNVPGVSSSFDSPVDPFTNWPPAQGCWMSPFGDWYINKNIEMVKRLNWDGQNIDGFYTTSICHCKYCTDAYRKFSGQETPLKIDAADSNYRRYIRWRMDEWAKFVRRWNAALKNVKPDFGFIPWSTGPGRWWHWTFLPAIEGSEIGNMMIDAPILELFWDFPPDQSSNLLPAFTVAFYRGMCRERPVWFGTYFFSQGQSALAPRVEAETRLCTVLTNGGVPFIGDFCVDKTTKKTHYDDMIKSRRQWTIGAKSVKWAAMVVSETSRLFYGLPSIRSEHAGTVIGSGVDTSDITTMPPGERRMPAQIEASLGVFRACREAHVPLDIITDYDLEQGKRLNDYKVIILPDVACMSDKAAGHIRDFVKNGGGVVATQCTSLYNDFGDKRENIALADVLGVDYESAIDATARWPFFSHGASIQLEKHPIVSGSVIDGSMSSGVQTLHYMGWMSRVKARSLQAVIATYKPIEEWIQQEKTHPFAVVSEYGKGRAVYFAAAIDQSYFIAPYRYQRAMLANAITWVVNRAVPPVEVKAPLCVQSTFFEQENGKRTIVHLLNEVNTTANGALPEMEPSVREEVLPVADIKLSFSDMSIKKVHLQPEGIDLTMNKAGGKVEVTVPKLEIHSMVIAER